MTRRVVFRADGNGNIGYGHVVRSLAIASMINELFDCCFATVNPPEFFRNEISSVCHQLVELKDPFDDAFLNMIDKEDIIVLDNYYFTTDYQHKIRALGCSLVCIDDIQDKKYACDLVINHAPGLELNRFDICSYTSIKTGIEYAMLRQPFLSKRINSNFDKDKSRLFVCFGGADKHNIAFKIVETILGKFPGQYSIDLLAGASTRIEFEHDELKIHHSLTSNQIVDIMDQCILAIVPASTILFEVCSRNVPAVTGYYVDNQELIYEGFKKAGLIIPYGNFNKLERFDEFFGQINVQNLSDLKNKLYQVWPDNIKYNYQSLFQQLSQRL